MVQLLADRNDIQFVLHEQFDVSQLSDFEPFTDFNKSVIDMILKEVRNLAIKEILPTNQTGDREGCTFSNGTITMPESFKTAWQHLREGEWFAPCQDVEWGGQGIPHTLNVAAQNYLFAANLSLLMVAGLNHAAGEIIETFGTDLQKKLYLKNLYTGHWSGTMLLTEADSGSNLGDLSATARRNGDGTYLLSGNKVFISGGDHDMADNIVHLVLARIEGAPEGSRGISLFIAPKIILDEAGAPIGPNDIVCTGIEEKMGLHGSPTCTMALGSRGKCFATLVGEENKGLSIMFLMMNKARLMVGSQGLACASSAYLYALDYARSRIQGALITDPEKKSVPIIQHPDIRRMLLTMKAYTEGSRSLLCYIAFLEDQKGIQGFGLPGEKCQDLIDILIPIAKAYVTDRAVEVCNMAVQVFGGYGYTNDFPVEQLLRDVRITTIYEGTNGIQAMDLLGRKIPMAGHRLFHLLLEEIDSTVENALSLGQLKAEGQALKQASDELKKTVERILSSDSDQDLLVSLAHASQLLEVFGDVILAWMLLWRGTIALKCLNCKPKKKWIDFYSGQLKSARFYYSTILPVTFGKMDVIQKSGDAAIEISDSEFGVK
ncbi:MAG: acyl-CoA dehydrogenase [Desulfobacteraceae bacterium]|nr:MAG: acyl-CoA dehydrogenase [Desulfobacteraceae bacterium]